MGNCILCLTKTNEKGRKMKKRRGKKEEDVRDGALYNRNGTGTNIDKPSGAEHCRGGRFDRHSWGYRILLCVCIHSKDFV